MSTGNTPSTPSMNVKTSFIPQISGGWWPPSYYVFILTIVAVLINFIVSIIQSKGVGVISHLMVSFSFLIVTYYSARTSTCLWSGGCRVFSVLTLITPIIMLVTMIFKDIMNITMVPINNKSLLQNNNSIRRPKPRSNTKSQQDADDLEEEEEEDYPEPPDGGHKESFTNSFPNENYSSYCPY